MKTLLVLLLSFSFLLIAFATRPALANNVFFPYGIFEDAGITNTTTEFEAMITDLKAQNLDSVLFTNNKNATQLPMLDVSDQLGFNVIWGGPMDELSSQWFNNPVQATPQNAESIIGPLVDSVKSHSSVKGYNLRDDSVSSLATKIKLALDVFKQHDPNRAHTAVFVPAEELAYRNSGADTLLTYYYPAKQSNTSCDWNFSTPTANDLSYNLRDMSRNKSDTVPLWTVLQTHLTTSGAAGTLLRVPTTSEINLQNWINLGEGSKGIFWFIYSSQQGWIGVKDSSTIKNQIGTLATRTKPLTPILLNLIKTNDYFTVSGTGNRYISTLFNPVSGKYYLIVVNANCTAVQQLTITSSIFGGQLKDVETGLISNLNTPVSINSADAKFFEVINLTGAVPNPTTNPNLIVNQSFETVTSGAPSNWNGAKVGASLDTTTAHTGTNSFKLVGPSTANSYSWQKPVLKPGNLYTVKYWIKTASQLTGTGVGLRLGYAGVAKEIIRTTTLTPNWQEITETFIVPPNFISGTDRIDLIWDLKTGETAWVDDVSLCEGINCLAKVIAPAPSSSPSIPKLGDIVINNKVDIFDYNALLTDFGKKNDSNTVADLDNDNDVDIFDYNILLTNFGQ